MSVRFFLIALITLSQSVLFSQSPSIQEINKTYTDLDEALSKKEKVYHLNLSHRDLKSIPVSILELVNLKSLYLTDNLLDAIDLDLSTLTHLELIDLSGNLFKEIPVAQLRHCKSLKALNFRRNNLKELNSDLSQLIRLRALDLGENEITQISKLIKLPGIQFLRLDENRLSEFPEALADMRILRELSLENNMIENLSPAIMSKFTKLKKLNLSKNPLSDLNSLKYLSRLTQLRLNGISLNKEDLYAVFSLAKLKYLYLENADIDEIPSAISNLKKLEELYLAGNQIEKTPDVLSQMNKLRFVNLEHNPMNTLSVIELQNQVPKAEIKL